MPVIGIKTSMSGTAMSLHCMLSDKPGTDFDENSGLVGKPAWMFALNPVVLQGLPFRMFVA